MSSVALSPRREARIQLNFRKGSRVIPIFLLFLSVALFVIYGLPSGHQQLGLALGLIKDVNDPLTIEELQKRLGSVDALTQLVKEFQSKNWGVWDYVENIFRPLFKIFLDQLGRDFITIVKSGLTTLVQLSLFSLLPGLAGLIYRRNFWVWFLASLLILLSINASGIFGRLTSAEVMPWSGAVFFFLLFQVGLLLLAYRLRRHVQSASFWLPPKVHNWGLTALLVFVGIACWQGWGPGYSSGGPTDAATKVDQRKEIAAESQPGNSGAAETNSRAPSPTSPTAAPSTGATDKVTSTAPAAQTSGIQHPAREALKPADTVLSAAGSGRSSAPTSLAGSTGGSSS